MGATGTARIVSRCMVRPSSGGSSEDVHLTPWDLRLLTIYYIQMGIVLPKPPVGGKLFVDALASSLARTLLRYYHFAGRLAVKELGDGTVTVSLRCNGDGAEHVHAEAPGVAVADLVGSVTELVDGVFIALSMNHSVGDGTNFWEFFKAWSEIHRGKKVSTPAPVHGRWFVETSPVPIPLPLSQLRDVLRRVELPPVREAFFTFSAESVKKLKARANEEMAGIATATISSLQALLAHHWRAVCRARLVPRGQETFYVLVIGCRGRVHGIPPGYVGSALVVGRAVCAAGEVEDKGLGWTAWQLNRTAASFDEATLREFLELWVREPTFPVLKDLSAAGGLEMSNSPRFDVFGNDFGWGRPLGVRSGLGADDKSDGKATVFEGPEGGGSMSLEVCLAADVLDRLLVDNEFMDTVTVPLPAA